MASVVPSLKQVQIDKANIRIFAAIAATVFVVVFCAVATKTLVSRQSYQGKVISAREKARDQLKENIQAANQLTESYKTFVADTPNVIEGNPAGSGERDGDNAKIVLDALPSVYDFPALTSSLEKLITNEGLKIGSITGTDDEVNQSGQTSNEPVVVEMPFTVSVNGTYQNINNLVLQFEKSIRPFNVTKFVFAGGENGTVDLTIDAKSFYQPAKNLEVKKETVK
jgi:Tfp pilus assembly protein PilO